MFGVRGGRSGERGSVAFGGGQGSVPSFFDRVGVVPCTAAFEGEVALAVFGFTVPLYPAVAHYRVDRAPFSRGFCYCLHFLEENGTICMVGLGPSLV